MKFSAVALALLLGACALIDPPLAPRSEADPAPPPTRMLPSPDWPRLATRYLQSQKAKLRGCYDRELHRVEDAAAAGAYKQGQRVPSLAGKLVLALPVEADGSVVAARVDDDTLQNANVRACLLDEAKSLRFAPPTDGKPVELALPFAFTLAGP